MVNLSVLKNGRAEAVRFSTLTQTCDVLGCQPGDVLSVLLREAQAEADRPAEGSARSPVR